MDWSVWGELLRRVHEPEETVRVALVGKYVDLPDAYLSVTEAIRAGGFAHWARTGSSGSSRTCAPPTPVRSTSCATSTPSLIPGGFGIRGIEGKVGAIRYAAADAASRY